MTYGKSPKPEQSPFQIPFSKSLAKYLGPLVTMTCFLVSHYHFGVFLITLIEPNNMLTIYLILFIFYLSSFIPACLLFESFYRLDNDFVKQFRTLEVELPWVENPKGWAKLKKKMVPVIVIFSAFSSLTNRSKMSSLSARLSFSGSSAR